MRLELVNGERVLPINRLAVASGAAEWGQLFLDFTFSDTYGSKEGSESCGKPRNERQEKVPRCELGVFGKGMDDRGIAMGGREVWG